MTKVAIIGGGRWARTIAGVLAGLPAAPQRITLHSRHNAVSTNAWIACRGLEWCISVNQHWPDYQVTRPDAVIVANRAADHESAAASALDARIAVLVEKPVAIRGDAVRRLQARAFASGTLLAASHVFLLARYFEAFTALVARRGPARKLEMTWEDGQGDVMRGEVKSYDTAVPVFDDVLPHVLPMLQTIAQRELTLTSLAMEGGGSQVTLEADAGGLPVTIRLARNARGRRRVLAAHTASGICALDFSQEPGMLSEPGVASRTGDPAWDSEPRPLGAMLTSFLRSVGGDPLDPRLSPDRALASALFADDARPRYRALQGAWLASSAPTDAGRAYALLEISSQT